MLFYSWVFVLISIGGLILFIGLCVCICKVCCGSSWFIGVVMYGVNLGEWYINEVVFVCVIIKMIIFIGRLSVVFCNVLIFYI